MPTCSIHEHTPVPELKYEQLRTAVRALVAVFSVKGVDLQLEAQLWASRYLKTVGDAGTTLEQHELLRAGCKSLPHAESFG
jgi:hypothetical protein